MKGFSRATIQIEEASVIKTGEGVFEQGKLCETYPLNKVCPKVLEKFGDSYRMERLEELRPLHIDTAYRTMKYVRQLLARHVWPIQDTSGQPRNWEYLLAQRFHDVTSIDIEPMLCSMWLDQANWQVIHGDPTLSNTMIRGYDFVLIDPLRSPYIPSHWTVDMGKLLQSAVGWEKSIAGWSYDGKVCAHSLTIGMDPMTVRRAWFWCMVHCMRIIPYADTEERAPQRLWAEGRVAAIHDAFCRDRVTTEYICNTLSI